MLGVQLYLQRAWRGGVSCAAGVCDCGLETKDLNMVLTSIVLVFRSSARAVPRFGSMLCRVCARAAARSGARSDQACRECVPVNRIESHVRGMVPGR